MSPSVYATTAEMQTLTAAGAQSPLSSNNHHIPHRVKSSRIARTHIFRLSHTRSAPSLCSQY